MTQEEILYKYYLKSTTESRDEAIELLEQRNFIKLHRNYIHWFDRKEKVVQLKSVLINEVIKEISKIKYQHNESEPFLSCCVGEDNSTIEIISHIYTIVPFEKCESLAKHYTSNALWKLKHQPNSKDAERFRKILNINYEKTT